MALLFVRQRIFSLACGYTDGNDAARLGDDALHKLLLDRDPLVDRALALAAYPLALREPSASRS